MPGVHEKIVIVILVLLALNNLLFFIVSLYSGPIIGFVAAAGLAIHWWIKKYSPVIMGIVILWIVLHIYEFIKLGASSYPIFFYLNLILPIPLFYASFKAYLLKKKEK